jgi:hypothetical protein
MNEDIKTSNSNKKLEPEYGSIKSTVQSINVLLMKLGTLKQFKVTDAVVNKTLDYIANYNKIILVFDIEFHNVVLNSNKEGYIAISKINKSVAAFVREIGLMFIVKDTDGNWNYLGSMFVNCNNNYSGNNIIYVLSKYTTVTDINRKQMEINDSYFNIGEYLNNLGDISEKEKYQLISKAIKRPYVKNVLGRKDFGVLRLFLGYLQNVEGKKFEQTLSNIKRVVKDIPFNITKSDLTSEEQTRFNKQMKIYYQDKQVVERTLNKSQEMDLFDLLLEIDKNTCYLVKGRMDFIALKNSYLQLYKKPCPIKFSYVYDIEIFNKLSQDKYGSATLLATYEGIINTSVYKQYIEKFINEIQNAFKDHRAHNPLSDSLYTLAVALSLNANLLLTLK